MIKFFEESMCLQSDKCSNYEVTSICSCDREIVSKPTRALLHQQSRFLMMIDGEGKIKIQGRIYDIKRGSLVSILPYQYSEIISVEKDLVFNLIVYNFDLFNELIKVHLNFFNEDISLIDLFAKNNVVHCDEEKFVSLLDIFNKLKSEVGTESVNLEKNAKRNFSTVYISSQILELLSIFERQATTKVEKVENAYENDDYIIQYIYLHLSKKMTLKELSQIFYMSESSISNYIHKRTGYSYSDLIFQMKMARTKNFLLYTNMNLEELSQILGYADSAHISKVFSTGTKQKISEYRKTYKKINTICKIKESKISYEIVNYIYRNYYLDLNPASVASKFNVTPVELNYHLKYLVEKNFDCFLNYVRINKSVKLLLETERSISSIASDVGYSTVRTYNRNFKRFYNTNPVKFRQQVNVQSEN